MDSNSEVIEDPKKVKDYVSLYGYHIEVLLDNESCDLEAELQPVIELLDFTDWINFVKELGTLETEKQVIELFRDRFDEFKAFGGNPLEWIDKTLFNLEKHFPAYPAIYRGAIQRHISEWNDFYLKYSATKQTSQPQPEQEPEQEPQPETTAGKIERIVKIPLKGAFDAPGHIDLIIAGVVSLLLQNELPTATKKAVVRMEMKEFIKPFRRLQDEKILKREQISTLLTYFIEKSSSGNTVYSQNYLNRLLSESTPRS